MGAIMNIKYQIIAGIVVLIICSLILINLTNNNKEPELTTEQQECEHEWECVDIKFHLISKDDYYIYCPKCKLEDAVTYKEWNKIRADQDYEEKEELRELRNE